MQSSYGVMYEFLKVKRINEKNIIQKTIEIYINEIIDWEFILQKNHKEQFGYVEGDNLIYCLSFDLELNHLESIALQCWWNSY